MTKSRRTGLKSHALLLSWLFSTALSGTGNLVAGTVDPAFHCRETDCSDICGTGDNDDYDSVMVCGLEAFYRTDWEEAEVCFEHLQNLDPDDPRGLFFSAMIPFWSYYFAGRDPEVAESFLELSDAVIQKAERKLTEERENVSLISMLSGLHGYRSLVASGEGKIRTALSSGSTGFTYTRMLLEREEEGAEVNIGRGIYHYMIGSIPASLRWLASLFGLHGDRQKGLEYLGRAARSDSYVRLDAKMVLVEVHRREEMYSEGLAYTRRLVSLYPKNVIFLSLHARLLEADGQYEQAILVHDRIAGMNHNQLGSLVERSRIRVVELTEKVD